MPGLSVAKYLLAGYRLVRLTPVHCDNEMLGRWGVEGGGRGHDLDQVWQARYHHVTM